MDLLIITIIALLIYVFYLRNKISELKNLQLMIALLQEQTLFLKDIRPAKHILEQEGDVETMNLEEAYEVLAKAYREGFYQLNKTQKAQVSEIRKVADKLFLSKTSKKKHRIL